MNGPKVFVSHTTRDLRDHAFAHALASELRALGADVWIAPDNIPAGQEWEPEIVQAILDHCTHFLVILSAASTAASWVLREISMAAERRRRDPSFTVLPMPVGALANFPEREFLDTFQVVPYSPDPVVTARLVGEVMGLHASAGPHRSLIDEKTAGFVGRAHVFAAIEEFFRDNDRGHVVIQGEPGIGKSAILAEFVRRTGCVAHFNDRSVNIVSAEQFLDDVCDQLTARYGTGSSLAGRSQRDGAYLGHLLDVASGRRATDERVVLAVDALDEAGPHAAPDGANVLCLPSVLPPGVYLVLTNRPTLDLPLVVDGPYLRYDLMAYPAENRRDAESYIAAALRRPGVREWADQVGVADDELMSTLLEKSDSNFMYLRYVLVDMEHGRFADRPIGSLPEQLEGYYEDHWRRMGMTARPLPRAKVRIIYVLCEMQRPVSRELLAKMASTLELELDELTVQEVLDEWHPFLRTDTGQGSALYSLYHASFRDFLHRRDTVQAAGVSLRRLHGDIAETIEAELFTDV